jgi:hypothetical protein
MISFGFLVVPCILFTITFILVLLVSCIWMILFYMQPNRASVKYKSFYQCKTNKQMNLKNFLDDDMLVNKQPKKSKELKNINLYPNIHHLKT